MVQVKKVSGLAAATAAAALFIAGCATAGSGEMQASSDKKVHCGGLNSCKGQTACKTSSNDCKGQNSCKGQGWMSMTKADCEAKGGKVL